MAADYLRFWGVRGSYPAPFASHMRIGGNTPCVELRVGGEVLIFDAGTGAIPLGHELARTRRSTHLHVFLTHYHWDHISGLPFFEPAFTSGFEIDVYAPGESAAEVERHIARQMSTPYFPVQTESWLAKVRYQVPEAAVRVGPATVSTFTLHHPGRTFGYRIEVAGKVILYAPDNEIPAADPGEESEPGAPDRHARKRFEAQRTETVEIMRNADLVIHDAQYTPQDYERKRGWGHSCYIDAIDCALDADVKQLFLFSYDPVYDDAAVDAIHEQARARIMERQARMVCHKTCEGMIIELGP